MKLSYNILTLFCLVIITRQANASSLYSCKDAEVNTQINSVIQSLNDLNTSVYNQGQPTPTKPFKTEHNDNEYKDFLYTKYNQACSKLPKVEIPLTLSDRQLLCPMSKTDSMDVACWRHYFAKIKYESIFLVPIITNILVAYGDLDQTRIKERLAYSEENESPDIYQQKSLLEFLYSYFVLDIYLNQFEYLQENLEQNFKSSIGGLDANEKIKTLFNDKTFLLISNTILEKKKSFFSIKALLERAPAEDKSSLMKWLDVKVKSTESRIQEIKKQLEIQIQRQPSAAKKPKQSKLSTTLPDKIKAK